MDITIDKICKNGKKTSCKHVVDVQSCTYFDCYIALGDFPHVESYSWDHVFIELSWLENKMENTNIFVKTHSERHL